MVGWSGGFFHWLSSLPVCARSRLTRLVPGGNPAASLCVPKSNLLADRCNTVSGDRREFINEAIKSGMLVQPWGSCVPEGSCVDLIGAGLCRSPFDLTHRSVPPGTRPGADGGPHALLRCELAVLEGSRETACDS